MQLKMHASQLRPTCGHGCESARRQSRIRSPGSRGFSMIEVLITIIVITVALLGAAKMQAAAVSNTQVARVRSLISLQAGSLASAMHGNPAFWASGLAPATFSASGTTVVDSTGVLNATVPVCSTVVCTPAQMAAYDVQTWAANLNGQIPTYSAAAQCSTAVGAPVTCKLQLNWLEKYVAINTSTAAGTQTANPSFSLFITP
jgi:type IV pilus assembly protein PilV